MGKIEEESSLSSSSSSGVVGISIPNENVDHNPCTNIFKFVRFRCVIVLLFSAAVFLSAIFWLPPLYHYRDRVDLDPTTLLKGHDVVAVFRLQKPVSLLKANIQQLEFDIFEEIGVVNSTVNVIYLEPLDDSNFTNVVLSVDPDTKYSEISSASLSVLRESFGALLMTPSSLRLTQSLFGDPISFEVLKFKGGITVIPPQKAFLLQKTQILFNFTLNFSIHQIQQNFGELKGQLKSGLHLNSYENVYVSLTNVNGSTVAHNTTVQASVLLTVGNNPPPLPRLKQLAQTIKDSPARNLGLNNTVFGRVKQVSLSSILQHSLEGNGPSGSPSPSPTPLPHPRSGHHYHHHHRRHHHNSPPSGKPPEKHHHGYQNAPAPAPQRNLYAKPPSGCGIGRLGKNKHRYLTPTVSPVVAPRWYGASPSPSEQPPAPPPNLIPASSPSSDMIAAPVPRSSENTPDVEPPDLTPAFSPLSSSFSAGGHVSSLQWPFALVLPLLASHLLL